MFIFPWSHSKTIFLCSRWAVGIWFLLPSSGEMATQTIVLECNTSLKSNYFEMVSYMKTVVQHMIGRLNKYIINYTRFHGKTNGQTFPKFILYFL